MNDQPEASDERTNGPPRKSRLDLEVEVILRKSDNVRSFPDPEMRNARARPASAIGNQPGKTTMPPLAKKALETPLLLALGFAILSFLVADVSPLLASLLAFSAVGFVLLPIVQRYRRPTSAPETKMWRGRVIDSRSSADSVIESLKQWWRSRRP